MPRNSISGVRGPGHATYFFPPIRDLLDSSSPCRTATTRCLPIRPRSHRFHFPGAAAATKHHVRATYPEHHVLGAERPVANSKPNETSVAEAEIQGQAQGQCLVHAEEEEGNSPEEYPLTKYTLAIACFFCIIAISALFATPSTTTTTLDVPIPLPLVDPELIDDPSEGLYDFLFSNPYGYAEPDSTTPFDPSTLLIPFVALANVVLLPFRLVGSLLLLSIGLIGSSFGPVVKLCAALYRFFQSGSATNVLFLLCILSVGECAGVAVFCLALIWYGGAWGAAAAGVAWAWFVLPRFLSGAVLFGGEPLHMLPVLFLEAVISWPGWLLAVSCLLGLVAVLLECCLYLITRIEGGLMEVTPEVCMWIDTWDMWIGDVMRLSKRVLSRVMTDPKVMISAVVVAAGVNWIGG